jgi:hypothetical protein
MNKLTAFHHKLCEEDPEYLKYVIAKSDSEAVEGSLLFDTYHAAEILRRADASLSTLKLAHIADVLLDLLGRKGPTPQQQQEIQQARMEYHGFDASDMRRLKKLLPRTQ